MTTGSVPIETVRGQRLMSSVPGRPWPVASSPGAAALAAGAAVLAVPTLYAMATGPWTSEGGSYGAIVLAIGTWLVARRWPAMRAMTLAGESAPGRAAAGWPVLAAGLFVHFYARLVENVSMEVVGLYLAGMAALYLQVGWPAMRRNGFALFYLALAIPPAPAYVAILTTHLRLAITHGAVRLLAEAGLMIAGEGLDIYVDGYRIAVAEACSGINSMVSLTAIGLFYVHARGRRLGPMSLPLVLASILVCAAAGNFVRVLSIVLMTHFFGEDVAQGPLHETAGLITFVVALGGVMLLDATVYRRLPHGAGLHDTVAGG